MDIKQLQADYLDWYCAAWPQSAYTGKSTYIAYPTTGAEGTNTFSTSSGNGNLPPTTPPPAKITTFAECKTNANAPTQDDFEDISNIKDIKTFLTNQRQGLTSGDNPYGQNSFSNPKWAKACCWNTHQLEPQMQKLLCTNNSVPYKHDSKFIPTQDCDLLMSNGATGYCDKPMFDPNSGNILNTDPQENLNDPSKTIPQGATYTVHKDGSFHGIPLKAGQILQSLEKIIKDQCKGTNPCDFTKLWQVIALPNTDDPNICACYNIDLSNESALRDDEKLYKALKSNNPDLTPNCVVNTCNDPLAYKSSAWLESGCPNVCSAISSDPQSQSYVGVTCGKDDIIVNNIADIIKNGNGSNMTKDASSSSTSNNNSVFRTPLFYVLLGILLLLAVCVIVKIVKRK